MKAVLRQNFGDLIPVTQWIRTYENHRGTLVGDPFYDLEEGDELDQIAYRILTYLENVFRPINTWWISFRETKKIKIDYSDIWSADVTLAELIVPVLKKLKEHKHGSPYVEFSDVPEHLRPETEPNSENGYVDETHHERWAYVLDEMIWAFEQSLYDWKYELYCHNIDQLDMKFVDVEGKSYSEIKFDYQKDKSKPKYFSDKDGIALHQARIDNGRRLFAKYYDGLWD